MRVYLEMVFVVNNNKTGIRMTGIVMTEAKTPATKSYRTDSD